MHVNPKIREGVNENDSFRERDDIIGSSINYNRFTCNESTAYNVSFRFLELAREVGWC
jgi:hypothetical protein